MKIFVSYSRRDAGDFADQIQRHLSSFKYDVFTDVNSIKVGEIWSNTIEENISNCDSFVVIVTHGSLLSPHVEREVLQAQREKKKIIPCFLRCLNPNRIKWGLEKIQGIEFSDKFELARNLYSKIDIESNIQVENEPTFSNSQDQSGGKLETLYRFSNKKSDEEKGDKISFAVKIGLSIENPEIEEGKESLLIGIIEDNEGKPIKDVAVDFVIFDTKIASFKEEEHPHGKITDSNGIVIQRFQAIKKGETLAAITVKDTELYAKTPLNVKGRTSETKKSVGEVAKAIGEEQKLYNKNN